jgi:hypothetical protein
MEIRICSTHLRTLHGDVTGDGRPDAIRVVGTSTPTGVCQLTLEVSSNRHRIRTAVAGPSDGGVDPGQAAFELVRLHRRGTLAIVVAPWQDGVTDFARLYVVLHDRLWNLQAPRPVGDGMFAFSGSMAGVNGVDCATQGRIEAAEAGPLGPKPYTDVRWYLTRRGNRLTVLPRLTVRRRSHGYNPHFEGLTGSPFPSCTVARSGRFR